MIKRSVLFSVLVLGLGLSMFSAGAGFAQVPTQVPFQGLLLDGGGAVVNGSVDLDFELFDALVSGNSLWSESQLGVIVVDGVYSVNLGTVTPLGASLFSGGALFLELTVSGETLVPRQQFLSVPFARRSESADSVGTGSALFISQMIEHFPFDGSAPGNLDPTEGTGDSDNDGIPNFADADNDNDGFPDSIELNNGTDLNLVTPRINSVSGGILPSYTQTTVVVLGNSFDTISSVQFGPETPTPTIISNTEFHITLVAATNATSEDLVVTLSNGETASTTIPIGAVAPVISGILPLTAPANQPTVLTLSGGSFYAGSTVEVDGQTYVPSSITETEIVVSVGPLAIGVYTVVVHHPNMLTGSRTYNVLFNNPNRRWAFVTDASVNGNPGGIAGLDALCQNEATAASLPGTYRAWASTSPTSGSPSSPATTFTQTGSPYARLDGVAVAVSFAGLTSGTLLAPIDITPTGVSSVDDLVWTGTLTDGTGQSSVSFSTCLDWTTSSSGIGGEGGDTTRTNGNWTTNSNSVCSSQRRIYCFEQ